MAQFRVSRHNRGSRPKLIATDKLDALLRAVAGFPNGTSVEEIRNAPGIELPKRTLQRRLAQLVGQMRLVVILPNMHEKDVHANHCCPSAYLENRLAQASLATGRTRPDPNVG